MPHTYVGSLSFDQAVGGVSADVGTLLSAVQLLLVAIATLKEKLELAVGLSASLKAAIELQLLADIELQLDANLALGLDLQANITDPSVFISGLVLGISDLQANLSGLVPTIALSASVDANLGAAVELGAKKLAITLLLDATAQIGVVLQAAVAVALAIAANAAITATSNLALVAHFSAPAIHLVRVDAPLASAVGAGTLAALAGSGLTDATNVQLVMLLVDTGNASGTAALNLAFAS